MKRKKHFLAIAAIASIMALSTSAQNTPKSDAPFILKKVLPQAKKADTKFKEIKKSSTIQTNKKIKYRSTLFYF